jgi:hypothetical protein
MERIEEGKVSKLSGDTACRRQEQPMTQLPLAVGIADAVTQSEPPLNVEATAKRLHKAFPEAEISREEIAVVLEEEGAAAGLATSPKQD